MLHPSRRIDMVELHEGAMLLDLLTGIGLYVNLRNKAQNFTYTYNWVPKELLFVCTSTCTHGKTHILLDLFSKDTTVELKCIYTCMCRETHKLLELTATKVKIRLTYGNHAYALMECRTFRQMTTNKSMRRMTAILLNWRPKRMARVRVATA